MPRVVIDNLWQGESGRAPWQRPVGSVSRGQNARFDRDLDAAAKRAASRLVAKLDDASGGLEYYWGSIREAIFAIASISETGVVLAWGDDGSPLTVIDDSDGSFDAYMAGATVDNITVAQSYDTVIVVRRDIEPRTTNSWSFKQCFNWILNGLTQNASLYSGGFQNNRTSNDIDRDVFDHMDQADDHYRVPANRAELKTGRVIRCLADYLLTPAGYYVWVADENNPYAWTEDESLKLFTQHDIMVGADEKRGTWFRVPLGRGPSGNGNQDTDADKGQGRARFVDETMPHRLVYDDDAGTITISACPWRQRLSGNFNENRDPSWTQNNRGQTIRSAAFSNSRMFLLGNQYLVGSRANDFFNLFLDNVSVQTDADRIDVPLNEPGIGSCNRIVRVGSMLFIDADRGQLMFGAAAEILTPANGRSTLISTFNSLDVEPGVTVGKVVIVDRFKDVHEYRFLNARDGIVYAAKRTAGNQSALYGVTPDRVFVTGTGVFITTGTEDLRSNEAFSVEDRLVQSAWGTIDFGETVVFLDTWRGNVRIITNRDDSAYSDYTFLRYVHRDVEPPETLEYEPTLDRMELVPPSEMLYDEQADETTIPHLHRNGVLGESVAVTTALTGQKAGPTGGFGSQRLRFVPAKRLDDDGNPVFDGDLTDDEVYLGFRVEFLIRLTRLYPAIEGRDRTIVEFAVFHDRTTDYVTEWLGSDGRLKSDNWQGVRAGITRVGEPPIETHFHVVATANTVYSRTDVTIRSSSPGPVRITAMEIVFTDQGRGGA